MRAGSPNAPLDSSVWATARALARLPCWSSAAAATHLAELAAAAIDLTDRPAGSAPGCSPITLIALRRPCGAT